MQTTIKFNHTISAIISLTFVIISSLLLSACGDLSYKRGASYQDLDKDKLACAASIPPSKPVAHINEKEAAKNTDEVIKQCLQARGWAVQNLGESHMLSGLLFTLPSSTKDASTEKAHHVTPNTNDLSAGQLNTSEMDKKAAEPTKSEVFDDDPYQVFKINSWWKSGSTANALKTDINRCVGKLGEAHKPSSSYQTATRGLIMCMQEEGWRAWRQPVSQN